LKNALKQKLAEQRLARQKVLKSHHELILQNIDALLKLVPEHGRTSCSDADPNNTSDDPAAHFPRCTRCQLLQFQRDNWISDSYVMKIELAVADLGEDGDDL